MNVGSDRGLEAKFAGVAVDLALENERLIQGTSGAAKRREHTESSKQQQQSSHGYENQEPEGGERRREEEESERQSSDGKWEGYKKCRTPRRERERGAWGGAQAGTPHFPNHHSSLSVDT